MRYLINVAWLVDLDSQKVAFGSCNFLAPDTYTAVGKTLEHLNTIYPGKKYTVGKGLIIEKDLVELAAKEYGLIK